MRRLWHALWIAPLALILFLGFLWMKADWDLRYMLRVLWHRDASTDDLR